MQLQLKISLDQITFGLRWIFLFVWLVLLSLFWFCFCFFKDSERFVLIPTIILASKLSIFSKNTEHFPYHIYVLIQTSWHIFIDIAICEMEMTLLWFRSRCSNCCPQSVTRWVSNVLWGKTTGEAITGPLEKKLSSLDEERRQRLLKLTYEAWSMCEFKVPVATEFGQQISIQVLRILVFSNILTYIKGNSML